MKTHFLLLLLLMASVSITGCFLIDTTNAQVSTSISTSKKNKVFVAEYTVEQNVPENYRMNFEEIWLERMWFNDIENYMPVKTIIDHYQLCFKIEQTPDLFFSIENYDNWFMKDPASNRYIGFNGSVYNLTVDSGTVNDVFEITLKPSEDEKIGTLTFRRK